MKTLTWHRQTNYGLIDVSMECSEGTTFRFTNNDNGSPNTPITCEDGFSLLIPRQQKNYGIINARMKCAGLNGTEADSNENLRGFWNDELSCENEYVIVGLDVRRQTNYGIINVKILCGLYKVLGRFRLSLSYRIECFVKNSIIHRTQDQLNEILQNYQVRITEFCWKNRKYSFLIAQQACHTKITSRYS